MRGDRRNHVPIILRSYNQETVSAPSNSTFNYGNIHPAEVAVGSASAQMLAKALSPWLRFEDESQIPIFYNIHTEETRRDLPLAVINEPLLEDIGGGVNGGWAS